MTTFSPSLHSPEFIFSINTIADVPNVLRKNLSPEELAVTSIFFDIDWTTLKVSQETFSSNELELWVHNELSSGRINERERAEIHAWVQRFPAESREGTITQRVIAELKTMVPCFIYLTARRTSIAQTTIRHLVEAGLPQGTPLELFPEGVVSTNGFRKSIFAIDLHGDEEAVNATRCMVLIDDCLPYIEDFSEVSDALGVRYMGIHYARPKEIPSPIRSEAIAKLLQRHGLIPGRKDSLRETKTSERPQG